MTMNIEQHLLVIM